MEALRVVEHIGVILPGLVYKVIIVLWVQALQSFGVEKANRFV